MVLIPALIDFMKTLSGGLWNVIRPCNRVFQILQYALLGLSHFNPTSLYAVLHQTFTRTLHRSVPPPLRKLSTPSITSQVA